MNYYSKQRPSSKKNQFTLNFLKGIIVFFIVFLFFSISILNADFTITDENYTKTFYIDNSQSETLPSSTWNASDTQHIVFKFLSEAPGAAQPENPVDTCDITIPETETVTINEGVSIDLGSAFRLIVKGALNINGTAKNNVNIKAGRGIHFESAVIPSNLVYCTVTDGDSTSGGALYVENFSDLTLDNCTISDNNAVYGGGIFLTDNADITIKNCIITNNKATIYGGGIYCLNSSPDVENCQIKNNSGVRFGGGIYLSYAHSNMNANRITDNSAVYGGGVFMLNSNPLFTNNIICNNLATASGGAIHLENSNPTISATTTAWNVAYESGGGIHMDSSSPHIINTIIYDNIMSPGEDPNSFANQIYLTASSLPELTFCNVMGGYEDLLGTGTGEIVWSSTNIDAPPMFENASETAGPDGNGSDADWHIKADSPCINRGSSTAQFQSTDIDGQPRPYNEALSGQYPYDEIFTDMGAYEFQNNPPFIGENGDDITLDSIEMSQREQIVIEGIPDGFDVDGNDVKILFYNPSEQTETSKTKQLFSEDLADQYGSTYSVYSTVQYGSTDSVEATDQNGSTDSVDATDQDSSSDSMEVNDQDSSTDSMDVNDQDSSTDSMDANDPDSSADSGETIDTSSYPSETGTFYQYEIDGDDIIKGAALYNMDTITDPENRLIYVPPNVEQSFTVDFQFKAHDGISLSPNSAVISISVDAAAHHQVLTESGVTTYYIDNTSTYQLTSSDWSKAQASEIKFDFLKNLDGQPTPDTSVESCEIIVPPGQTITIGNGVTVNLGKNFSLTIKGSIQAIGTEDQLIQIKAGKGIAFTSDATQSLLSYCNISDGTGTAGGALYVEGFSDLVIDNCNFYSNSAESGGAIFLLDNADVTIRDTRINNNTAGSFGGGICSLNSSPLIEKTVINNNMIMSQQNLYGGGIYMNESSPEIKNSTICDNSAVCGGGLYLEKSVPVIVNTIICNNLADASGGGLYLKRSNPEIGNATISNNLSYDNGGGIYLDESSPVVINTIIYGNSFSKGAGGTLSNDQIFLSALSAPQLSYSNIMGGISGLSGSGTPALYELNIDSIPLFVSPSLLAGPTGSGVDAIWSLQPDSPCINKGTSSAWILDSDINGNERPFNADMKGEYAYDEIAVDMGAFEFSNNPPFIGSDGNSKTLPLAYVTEGKLLSLKIEGGFDVDNDQVSIIYYSPSESDSQVEVSSDETAKGRIYQYKGGNGETTGGEENNDSTGEELLSFSSIEDSLYRIYYEPPEVEESFTDTLMFKAYDGKSISYNTIIANIYVTAIDHTEKTEITGIQENRLSFLGSIDENSAASDFDAVIAAITEVAGAALTAFNKNNFLNGARILAANVNLDSSQKLTLLNALDLFCSNNPEKTEEILSQSQASQLLFTLEQIESIAPMTGDEIRICAKIIDDLVGQQKGLESLSKELHDQVNNLSNALVEQSKKADFDIYNYEVGGALFQAVIHSNIDTSEDGNTTVLDTLSENSKMDINTEQVNQILDDINTILNDQQLTDDQHRQITEILDTLISRQELGTLILSDTLIDKIQNRAELLVNRSAYLFGQFSMDTYSNIRYWIAETDFLKKTDDIFTGDNDHKMPGVVISSSAVAELAGMFGTEKLRLTVVYQKLTTTADGSMLSVYFINEDSTPIIIENLENPIRITIPVTDKNRVVPKWHNRAKGEWTEDTITDVDDSINGMISFNVNHLTDFALFSNSDTDTDSSSDEDRSDTNLGSSGCFINTLFSN
ncbi:exported hypothetical protein [Desulfamplus magnetovallimortis]|uniref:Right handed beta helix domain-containing protein n=1 Tax=Desulfamplus magnetovallimortis TaxID=1246637 RepID=L0R435_9BACT|nr:right-handed parallel beta-helix repeat-containing protein [Desulfamplus magnetovallimortis]CCO06808.1 exported hypothetical protein [Desulfamplus magnetovallimortis BW-1]SLM32859.1 exported hypothetical protein [Desulfamplus magnetovallimortis]